MFQNRLEEATEDIDPSLAADEDCYVIVARANTSELSALERRRAFEITMGRLRLMGFVKTASEMEASFAMNSVYLFGSARIPIVMERRMVDETPVWLYSADSGVYLFNGGEFRLVCSCGG